MEQRTLEINSISAKDLKDLNLISKMDVYAVVSLTGDPQHPNQKTKTPVDRDGGTNPTWNFPIKFTIHGSASCLTLVFKLRCERAFGDKDVGEVHVPVKELVDSFRYGKPVFVSYQVRRPSGKPKGELAFSYKFSERVVETKVVETNVDQLVTAYPASVSGPSAPYGGPVGSYPPPPPPEAMAGYGYPPPSPQPHCYPPPPHQPQTVAGYGYPPPPPQPYGGYPPPPPPQGYAYTPPPPGYGYPPPPGYGYAAVQQPQKKGNKFGMGLGAGLLGGAIGGLLIGDMISDGGAYDAGYDAGFGDGIGF